MTVPALSARLRHSLRLPPPQEAQIALTWLARLRWLAVGGQVLATLVATQVLGMVLPLGAIALVIGLTVLSNVGLLVLMRRGRAPAVAVPAVLLLDVAALTALLACTGGQDNPFSALYLVHVAMAVAVLGTGWTWVVVIASVAGYAVIVRWHLPLAWSDRQPAWAEPLGKWMGLLLVAGLIAYFIGRVTRSLRAREQELARFRERAARNEQLAALTTLAAGAAHELGTPLGTIAVVAKELELSAAATHRDDAIAEDARLIRREVDRCRAILNRMRVDILEDVTHGSGGVALAELLRRVRADLAEAEQGRLEVLGADGAGVTVAPARAVQQAVGVLLRNAFDASPPASPVTLTVAARDGSIRFEVRDRGPGMPQEVLRRAGEPFFTTKAPGQGMGLGLFLVRLVAEKVGGRFELASVEGQGTCSVLELPL